MEYISLGVFAFVMFGVYDINSVKAKSKILQITFFIGVLLLSAATGLLLWKGWNTVDIVINRAVPFLAMGLFFLLLLIYTLFFALPFNETYISSLEKPKVCMKGIYGICRHPGFWCFLGMYACFAIAIPERGMIAGAAIFCILNFVYIVIQDMWTFPNCFGDYHQYKEKVPFLIPTKESLREGLQSLSFERNHK